MNILAEMLLTEPAPMAIWGSLMVLTTPALVVLANPDGVRNPGQTLVDTATFVSRYRKRRRARQALRDAESARVVRYAEEVRVAATQAEEAVDRWQAHWQAASDRVDAGWAAWQAADERQARSRAAASFGTPRTPRDPAEYADRERFLHRELRSAAARGDLPASALDDALAGAGGWDATLHPVEQELVLHRAYAAHLAREHAAAVAAEQAAWHDLQLARRSRDSLRREAERAHVLTPGPRRSAARSAFVVAGHRVVRA